MQLPVQQFPSPQRLLIVPPRVSWVARATLWIGLLSVGLGVAAMFIGMPALLSAAMIAALAAICCAVWAKLLRIRDRPYLKGRWGVKAGFYLGLGGGLFTVVVPAIWQRLDAHSFMRSSSNLRKLGIAIHDYHREHGSFPENAICDPEGNPLLSWRVAILPYLGESELYAEFRLEEPWDSEHHLRLLPRMPAIYRAPNQASDATGTYYQVFVGPDAIFAPGRKPTMQAITDGDGTSETILLVEAGHSVSWTKPEDVAYDADGPMPPLGGVFTDEFLYLPHGAGFKVVFADGSLGFIPADTDERIIRAKIAYKKGDKGE